MESRGKSICREAMLYNFKATLMFYTWEESGRINSLFPQTAEKDLLQQEAV